MNETIHSLDTPILVKGAATFCGLSALSLFLLSLQNVFFFQFHNPAIQLGMYAGIIAGLFGFWISFGVLKGSLKRVLIGLAYYLFVLILGITWLIYSFVFLNIFSLLPLVLIPLTFLALLLLFFSIKPVKVIHEQKIQLAKDGMDLGF